MTKIVAFTLIIAIFLALVNYLIFFWVNKRRKWKYEDVVFDEKVRKAAFEELQRTHDLLTESKEEYVDGRAYKTDSVDKILERR